jgi:hypothetical protein
MDTQILSPEQLVHFAEQGYVRIPSALSPAFVERVQSAIWGQLQAQYGVTKEAPHTWRQHGLINKDVIDRAAGVEVGPRLVGAVNQLLGEGRWRPLRTLGGLLVTFPNETPQPWERAFDWHFDNDPHAYLDGVTELMLFTFYSSVGPRGGGTLCLAGSPRLVERYIAATAATGIADGLTLTDALTDGLTKWHPWLAEMLRCGEAGFPSTATLMESAVDVHGVSVRIIELTGEPSDAVLCHPAMLHAVSANSSPQPRIMRRTNFRRRR